MGTYDDKAIGMQNQALGHVTVAWRASGPSWLSAAACRSTDPELFFPLSESGPALDQIAEAKMICAACPVRHQCLEFALRTRSQGIWGGLTELERHAAARPTREQHAPAPAARRPA